MTTRVEEKGTSPLPHNMVVAEGPVERLCTILCEAALVVMLLVIGVDIFTRAALNFSFELSDELGGYMLVLITFLAMPVCHVSGSFHHVEFVQARLPPRARAVSQLLFDVIILAAGAILLWQTIRLEFESVRSGDVAPTYLATPLWLPRIVMPIGTLAFCLSVARTALFHGRRLRRGVGPA